MKNSVCMAVYNGEKYLNSQISSILCQLQPTDELIIVDDCSSDRSTSIIQEFHDKRIKLIRNYRNLGVIKTFEKALLLSNGDFVFLSDQDDIWLPNKINRVVHIFSHNPKITLISSDAQVIDSHDILVSDSFFSRRGKFTGNPLLNLIQNKHLGCTLAFRGEMVKFFLPFPVDTPMHDIWIGLVNGIYGRAYFLDEALIQYRRHEKNTTSLRHSDFASMLKWRLTLCKNLANLILKHKLFGKLR